MKKLLISFFAFAGIVSTNAQSYLGYSYDNYAGVQSVLFNPASIVDSRFKTDINLVSASGLVGNDYYGVKINDVFKSKFDIALQSQKYALDNNNFVGNFDVMGPSFMFNIDSKNAIAIFSRARSIINISKINGILFNELQDGFDTSNSFSVANQNFNIVANGWAELGLSYATVLLNNEKNFLKGGLSVKYLQGVANSYFNAHNVSLNYSRSGTNPNLNSITTIGAATYGESQDFANNTNYKYNAGSTGLGLDLGFVYEFRPNYIDFITTDKNGKPESFKDKNKYKYRLGLSLTDLGSINYKDATEKEYNLNKTVTAAQFNAASNASDVLNLYTGVAQTPKKVNLPTAIHANIDWNIHNKFYLNLNGDLNLNSKLAINNNTIANAVMLTPRYETKWFSFYLPISAMEYRGIQAGSGFRFGPLFVGSGSVISNLISNKSKAIDFHLGLKIPIYQGKLKDKDADGVYDKFDGCPEVAGPVENNGCPWEDVDSDGTLDKDDKCPTISGPKENNGCPWKDSDSDSILDKDDKCPEIAGPKENYGCPWEDTDKDGILDKDDKCPTIVGTVANFGCPEVKIVEPVKEEIKQDVIKKINEYSKTILFDTGKATIKLESFSSLDAIIGVLNEYPTSNFKIEGHTDNVGKKVSNLILSKNRAAAVKNYFINKGINQDRLSSQGYGSSKPITSNKTTKGKNLNRRVEINLQK